MTHSQGIETETRHSPVPEKFYKMEKSAKREKTDIIWKFLKYMMYSFSIMAVSLVVYYIIDGKSPTDALFWGFLSIMFLGIAKIWERDYA